MAFPLPLLGPLVGIAKDVLGRILPAEKMSEEEKAKFEAEMKIALMGQENKELETRMSAILAEAKSKDPWTSRARPSLMWVMYIIILMGIPMGILSYFDAKAAYQVASGFQQWLEAVPNTLWNMFGIAYVGYAGARTVEKIKRKAW